MFKCNDCGHTWTKEFGHCPHCDSTNYQSDGVEEKVEPEATEETDESGEDSEETEESSASEDSEEDESEDDSLEEVDDPTTDEEE